MKGNNESHAAQEARATVDALTGNRPRFLGKKFQEEGELLGSVSAGPRSEWRVYLLAEEVYIGLWKMDPRCQGRYVPEIPEIGFLHLSGDAARDLATILKAL